MTVPQRRDWRVRLYEWSRRLKAEIVVLAIALRDPRTPRAAKWLGALVVAYALSPIDLIPDFVPILGYLDDVVLLPIGLWIVLRLIPSEVLEEIRHEQISNPSGVKLPHSRTAAVVIIGLWLLSAIFVAWWLYEWFHPIASRNDRRIGFLSRQWPALSMHRPPAIYGLFKL